MTNPARQDRYHAGTSGARGDDDDVRSPAARDRDRILYAPAFRRLAGITQVISPAQGVVVHNRLTHTLKVAQIARRLAEALALRQLEEARAYQLDPEVAEAAALAHDLGHPPFGHIAEEELCRQLDNASGGFREGFEGNAQSFRIVTVLEEHPGTPAGLDLTRATLDALLKYPWQRASAGHRQEKFGAYDSEEDQLRWARSLHQAGDSNKGLEAELMDWADDVAYSVHDLEDFYRVGMIPLDRLATPHAPERQRFEESAFARIRAKYPAWATREHELRSAFGDLLLLGSFEGPFDDSRGAREHLHNFSSTLITRYLAAISLAQPGPDARTVIIDQSAQAEVLMLKQLTWQYVVDNPALAIEQHGQRRIIAHLFATYAAAAEESRARKLFPKAWQERLTSATSAAQRLRTVADFIASLTEHQALRLAGRLTGHQPMPILEAPGL